MVDRTVFVEVGDEHAPLDSADTVVDGSGLRLLRKSDGNLILATYATLAAAIADTANLVNGQRIIIQGGDEFGTGFTNADRGIWSVDTNQGAANTDYTKQLDVSEHASEIEIGDVGGFFSGADVEAALQEIGTKQIAYKRADTSLFSVSVDSPSTTAFDAAITALVLDNGSFTDSDGVGDSVTNGVIVNATRGHKIPIRDSVDNDVFSDGNGNEIYARITNPAGTYVIEFYSDINGTETRASLGTPATGNVALSGQPNDGDTVVIDDGINAAVTFEFDNNASVVETTTLRQVVIGATVADTIDNLIAAVNGAPTLDVTASDGTTTDDADLTNDFGGTHGNVALTGTDTAAVQTLTGMSGGVNEDVDLGYVWVSMDFMKLPALAGITEGEFFGDQAGVVGVIDDANVTTNSPAFTDLLTGLGTQEAVNERVDSLGSVANGEGASLIGIEDAAGNFTATDVEGALAELANFVDQDQQVIRFYANGAAAAAAADATWEVGDIVVISGDAGNESERGVWEITANTGTNPGDTFPGDYTKRLDVSHTASEVLIADGTAYYTGGQVEAALDELAAAIGGTNSTTRDYSSNNYVADNDDLVTAIGKLDAAIAASNAAFLNDCSYVAAEAINAATNGPRLVAATATSREVELANASDTGTNTDIVGFAFGADYAAAATIDQGNCVVSDGVVGGFTGLTIGAVYYADPAGEGDITATKPSTRGQFIVKVGVAVSATELFVEIGEPVEIAGAGYSEVVIWRRDTSATAGVGIGENGFSIQVGEFWADDDTSVQNPTKNGLGRYTLYVCTLAWTGSGVAATMSDVRDHFTPIGKQN